MNNEIHSCFPVPIVDSRVLLVEFAYEVQASNEGVSLQNDVNHFCFHSAKSKVM